MCSVNAALRKGSARDLSHSFPRFRPLQFWAAGAFQRYVLVMVPPMKRESHLLEKRQGVIFRHTSRMLHETRCSWEAFSQRLVEHYHDTVAPQTREIQFKTDGDIFQCARANAQKISRFADNRVQARLPVELEEAWVSALTDPYRSECLHDLARRFGLLAVPVPITNVGPASAIQAMSSVTREFGQACEALAPIIADGTFGPEDVQHIERAARELEDLIAAATSLLSQVRTVKRPVGT